jgi:hypothetical protein
MNSNVKPSDRVAVVGNIDPDAYTTGTYTTGWIDMSKFLAIMAVVQAGTLGSSATLDAKIQQATSAAGASAKDVTGKAIAQLTQAGADSDKQAVINLFANELDINNGFTHVQLSITVGTATSDAGAIVLGLDPVKDVASANGAATVDEIV